jgi:hypothetical protein
VAIFRSLASAIFHLPFSVFIKREEFPADMIEPQFVCTKSRERAIHFGEVFTPEKIVNDMLDLVEEETRRIDSRFLDPACGTGNFPVAILRRKLKVIGERYGENQQEYERYALLAVSSIYGIELLEDNVRECRTRLFEEFKDAYTEFWSGKIRQTVICGRCAGGSGCDAGGGVRAFPDGTRMWTLCGRKWM